MERQPFIEEISKSFERGLVKTTNVKISFNIHKKQFEDIFNNNLLENLKGKKPISKKNLVLYHDNNVLELSSKRKINEILKRKVKESDKNYDLELLKEFVDIDDIHMTEYTKDISRSIKLISKELDDTISIHFGNEKEK